MQDAQGYRLTPNAEAVAAGTTDWARDPSAGYGVSVIPLEFVSAQTLIKLLDSYAAKPGSIRAEPSRNLIIVQGIRRTAAAIETALSFDADWMLGQSVASIQSVTARLNRLLPSSPVSSI